MPTNDEIKYKGGVELANNKSLESVIDKMLKEARADTAKQIFKELEDNVIHIRGNNEDIRISWSSAKKYFTLKKKYNIEE